MKVSLREINGAIQGLTVTGNRPSIRTSLTELFKTMMRFNQPDVELPEREALFVKEVNQAYTKYKQTMPR